jgi:hypothetical protein
MSFQSTMRTSFAVPGAGTISGQVKDVGATLLAISQGIGSSVTDQNLTLAFTLANVQSFFFMSDQPATIKTNSTGSPDDTITLLAGIPLVWSRSSGIAQPLTHDVTTIYVTTGTAAANLSIEVLTN